MGRSFFWVGDGPFFLPARFSLRSCSLHVFLLSPTPSALGSCGQGLFLTVIASCCLSKFFSVFPSSVLADHFRSRPFLSQTCPVLFCNCGIFPPPTEAPYLPSLFRLNLSPRLSLRPPKPFFFPPFPPKRTLPPPRAFLERLLPRQLF